jgi:hypothetical protein
MKRILLINSDKEVFVDDEDFEGVSEYQWRLRSDGYIQGSSSINRKNIMLHRLILRTPVGFDTDHINHNLRDNRRENLRIATHSQNLANGLKRRDGSSQFKGVRWHKERRKWQARIGYKGKNFHLGLFKSEKEAAIAYDLAALKYFKKFSYLNFPERITLV